VRGPSAVTAGGADRSASVADVFQSPDLAALAAKNQDVVVSGVELP
jgi:hypothetical protein